MNSVHHDGVPGDGAKDGREEQQGHRKAGYGEQFIGQLAIDLTARFGVGFSCTNVLQAADALIVWLSMQPEAAGLLRQLIMVFRSTQLVYVAAKLGLADRLAEDPRTAAELAEQVGTDPDALHRILRALATLGIFGQDANGRFKLHAAGEGLRSNIRGSMRNVALLYGDEWLWQAYGRMLFSVQTGKPAFSAAHGQGFYEFLDENAAAAAVFQAAMDDFSNIESTAILDAYNFARAHSVIDVGSGRGALLAAVLQAYPQLRGVAFDTPSAEPECTRRFNEAGLTTGQLSSQAISSVVCRWVTVSTSSRACSTTGMTILSFRFLKSFVTLCRPPRASS